MQKNILGAWKFGENDQKAVTGNFKKKIAGGERVKPEGIRNELHHPKLNYMDLAGLHASGISQASAAELVIHSMLTKESEPSQFFRQMGIHGASGKWITVLMFDRELICSLTVGLIHIIKIHVFLNASPAKSVHRHTLPHWHWKGGLSDKFMWCSLGLRDNEVKKKNLDLNGRAWDIALTLWGELIVTPKKKAVF